MDIPPTVEESHMTELHASDDTEEVPENERRWLVLSMDPDIRRSKSEHLIQGYLDGGNGPRIRTIDDRTVEMLLKTGNSNIARIEDRYKGDPVPISCARWLLKRTRYTLTKRRYKRDGWDIDFFEKELAGLVLVEFEMEHPDQEVTLPSWVHKAIEVTDILTNRMLAKLAYDISIHGIDRPVRDYIIGSIVPRIAFTGAPGGGKDTAIAELMARHGDKIECVNELVSVLVQKLDLIPPTDDAAAMIEYQRNVYRIQNRIEHAMMRQAIRKGKRMVLVNRGTLDSAAYLPGGVDDFLRITRSTLQEQYARYTAVFCLEAPPKKVYDAIKGNNPARRETHAEAVENYARIHAAYKDHPRLITIPNGGSTWEPKMAHIEREFLALLKNAEAKRSA